MGPTLPNRLYLLAATSFGHVSTEYVPPEGLKRSTGNILDLLDSPRDNLDRLLIRLAVCGGWKWRSWVESSLRDSGATPIVADRRSDADAVGTNRSDCECARCM